MKKSVKSILVLVCICAVVSVLLALTNSITDPMIQANEQKNANAALLEVLPEGGSFEKLDISSYTLPSTVSEVYRAENGGYAIKLSTTGYASGMVLMCGIGADGTVGAAQRKTGGICQIALAHHSSVFFNAGGGKRIVFSFFMIEEKK